MRRMLRGFVADRGGATAMVAALSMTAVIGAAALGVDLGDVYMRSRQLQGMADLAAMAAVQSLDPAASATPQATAQAAAALNAWPGGVTALATEGVYTPDPTLAADHRFTAGGAAPNAVQVELRAPVRLFFAGVLLGRNSVQVSRTGLAARAQYTAFSIGSGLASLNGGVANALLSALTGSQVQLSVMDYQALASAKVDLLAFMPALQTRAGLQAGGFDQLLNANVAPSAALNALADTLASSGQAAAAASARQLASASAGLAPTALNSLFDLGPYTSADHAARVSSASLQLDAFSLASALLQAANGGRQLSLSLDSAIPGLAKLSVWLAIGQRPAHSPWLTITDAGQVVVRTAQMRLYLLAQLSGGGLAGVPGAPLVQLPLYVEAASAQARLQDIQCPADPGGQAVDLLVSPSVGMLAVGQVDPTALSNFAGAVAVQPATLLDLGFLKATASSQVTIGGGAASWAPVPFSQSEIASGAMKSVFTDDIARATLSSLLGSTTVQVSTPLGGMSAGGATLGPQLKALILQAGPPLDGVLSQLEAVTGVRLGEADVWANGLRCRGAALVA